MAKIFITGSADGLGQLTASALIKQDHDVVLHARNEERGRQAIIKNPGAKSVVTGDLSDIGETKDLAFKVNELGPFDAIIHNAGVYRAPSKDILAVNVLAPYILSAIISPPRRLIYLTSGMHLQGKSRLDQLVTRSNNFTYSDSKLLVVMLCMAIARKWKSVCSNAVNPGWVPTKMGGAGAPDNLQMGYETQVWLAVSNDEQAKVSGKYFFHRKVAPHHPDADDVKLQERFLSSCKDITGIPLE